MGFQAANLQGNGLPENRVILTHSNAEIDSKCTKSVSC